ncbi:cation diffusion facilitator family transporter [Anaerorudis cellulosivorans]|uniref:cation diffusion facilitator family transporter n=1 Tax=Anaerorudis cellulosivorans TaxID=3397862 RepID=UPI00221F1704|nr:cation diffusion facilitator family transporter [Seramator thermalis]MCW1734788.1 cation diffusion facilitator family transporter [Seramator thermalis]
MMKQESLKKFIYLSIAAAVVTILLKFYAFYLTGSMGFFSDALESFVNLFAAVVALIMLTISAKPADKEHEYGHSKAEYFSSAIEGALIVLAALSILLSAVPRLFDPKPLTNIDIGLVFSLAASLVNLTVSLVLIHNGKKKHSLVLEADGKHIMTDVWTSAGVIAGILVVRFTGIYIFDPIIAIAVAINIIYTGYQLISRSASGLMDASISDEAVKKITAYLDSLKEQHIEYHSLMTRQAGQRMFISVHLLVPGWWTVKKGHDYADLIEQSIENMFEEPVNVSTHIEPIDDPTSMNDIGIYRKKTD